MNRLDALHTQRLTRDDLQLIPRGRTWARLTTTAALLVAAATAFAGLRYVQDNFIMPSRVATLERENARFVEDLHRTRAELELEQATKAKLKREVADLNEQVTELNHQLGFFNSRGSRRED